MVHQAYEYHREWGGGAKCVCVSLCTSHVALLGEGGQFRNVVGRA